jgi:hypothetical protein
VSGASKTNLGMLASLIRSKNAGPFWITFDLMFDTEADFLRVVKAGVPSKRWIAETYRIPEEEVLLVQLPQARAIKFSFPRPRIQGDPGESDMYSGQQYAPLLDLPVE